MTDTQDAVTASEQLLSELEVLATAVDMSSVAVAALDPMPRRAAEDLRAAVEAIHRAALVTVVRKLREDPRGRELLFELVDDPVVHLLLSLHGIIRPDPMVQAQSVLDTVRPALQSHGGDVELVRVESGVAYVKLSGACNGCSMSAVTMRTGVEKALTENIPSITSVEVLPNDPTPTLFPLSDLHVRREDQTGWVKTSPPTSYADGEIVSLSLSRADGKRVDVIVINIGGQLSAYVDACAHQGRPLGNGMLDVEAGTLTCPWHGFCYDALSGECMSAPGAQLEQLPLRIDSGQVWIRVGT
jgi:Fe-S cluster biogenesis protein NfuA/nitrite reductase/ring-hydroxylating ferredoxin subunit